MRLPASGLPGTERDHMGNGEVKQQVRDPNRIAVIDDDHSVRKALCRLLNAEGFNAVPFPSANEFLDEGNGAKFACLVLDIHLGGMSGLDLMDRLSGEGQAPPVVLITAHDDEPTRERAIRAGASAYLRKPLDAQVLLEAIRTAIAGSGL